MSSQDACPLRLHRVPHVAVEVVVARQEEAAAAGEGHARDAADDVVVRVHGELLVRADVEQATGRVVRARGERPAVREESDGVDITLVSGERLLTGAVPNVPQLG